MRNIRTLAVATYGDITRRPLYYILLFTFSLAIFGSKFLTLFSFYQEMNMVREMGMATITFWGFIILVVTSLIPGIIVLSGILFLTLWMMAAPKLPLHDRDLVLGVQAGSSPFMTAWRITWEGFILKQSGVVLEGALLSFLQTTILAAVAVSFSA